MSMPEVQLAPPSDDEDKDSSDEEDEDVGSEDTDNELEGEQLSDSDIVEGNSEEDESVVDPSPVQRRNKRLFFVDAPSTIPKRNQSKKRRRVSVGTGRGM